MRELTHPHGRFLSGRGPLLRGFGVQALGQAVANLFREVAAVYLGGALQIAVKLGVHAEPDQRVVAGRAGAVDLRHSYNPRLHHAFNVAVGYIEVNPVITHTVRT